MLTLKVISQETEKVLKGLEKKHFKNAEETINKVLELDKERRAAQQELDNVLAQNKQLAAKIGQLMKAGSADEANAVKEEVAEEDKEAFKATSDSLIEIFRKELGNDKLDVKIEKLKDEKVASMITLSEQNRRMQEMMRMYGMGGMGMDFGGETTLILNANHPLVQYVVNNKDNENVSMICKQLYDLAMISHKPLNPEEMTALVQRSNEIMMLLTK